MENSEKYREDISEIRRIMERSSKFISLSGLSGVLSGTYALIGAYIAYQRIYSVTDTSGYGTIAFTSEMITELLVIAGTVLILSVGTGIFLTTQKARKQEAEIWDYQTWRLIINLLIPLLAGGIFSLILLFNGIGGLVAPVTLIFYGLALVNASKYTLSEIRGLGIFETLLGLLAACFIGYGLLFWTIGFGVLHIIYGVVMYLKYDK